MCTMIVEQADISGSGKGPHGWLPLTQVNVSYDHPFHASLEYALNIDFVNGAAGLGARVAVELTPESARDLVKLIMSALERAGNSGYLAQALIQGQSAGPFDGAQDRPFDGAQDRTGAGPAPQGNVHGVALVSC